ncbi:MAG: DUF4031 domain-containing protein [Rhodobacter sp.]|nr:DUF4031 domain-containing protein [Rhodobacter sp.]MCA3479556.1 DUF4031 domain-containing protein [Rhodobacter sp.]MCA3496263.1 DUF4031 domain-containing protein [Rhodobacter sp.]
MTVYVDNMRAKVRGMVMCHMLADSTAELLAMADRIGVDRKHLQDAGTYREHLDICLTKRAAAVAAGALEVSVPTMRRIIRDRRDGVRGEDSDG